MNRHFRRVTDSSTLNPNASSRSSQDFEKAAILGEEIANLPETFRAAVVLCEIDRVIAAEAAKQLGIAEKTLSSWLTSAQEQLNNRLLRRGISLTSEMFALLADTAHAAVPGKLTEQAAKVTAGELPRPVARIADSVMRSIAFENKINDLSN